MLATLLSPIGLYSVKDAQSYLKKSQWRLDIAVDNFYANPPATPTHGSTSASRGPDVKKIGALFDHYKGQHAVLSRLDG